MKAALERLDVGWTVIGAVAAASYRSSPRPTDDVDVLILWDERLAADLIEDGFDVRVFGDSDEPEMIRASRRDGTVDLIAAATEYQRLAIDRSVDHVLTVEDVLVHKLIAWRPRDQDDVASILSTGLEFDETYIAHWAREWGISDRWASARGNPTG